MSNWKASEEKAYKWFKANFGNSTGNFEPGTPVAGTPSVTAQINPAVWVLDFNQNSYYIPENIPQDGESYTKLRITASIAIPTAIPIEPLTNTLGNLDGKTFGSLLVTSKFQSISTVSFLIYKNAAIAVKFVSNNAFKTGK